MTIQHVETLNNGRQITIAFTSIFGDETLRDMYLEARKDIKTLGLKGAHQKWHDEEAVERRKLGLKVKDRY